MLNADMLRDTIIAAIRTGVAGVVGILITWLFDVGVEVPDSFAQGLGVVIFGLVILAYNLVVSFLERRAHPLFGLLLGIPKAPTYGAVATQTPPPARPLLGKPRVDRS